MTNLWTETSAHPASECPSSLWEHIYHILPPQIENYKNPKYKSVHIKLKKLVN